MFAFLRGGDDDGDNGDNGGEENDDESGGGPSNPGESRDTAPPLSEGRYGPYEVSSGGEHYFALDLQEGDELTITISFSDDEGDLDLELQNSQGTAPGPTYLSLSPDDNETISPQIDESGTYYARIYGVGTASNSYEIEVEIN